MQTRHRAPLLIAAAAGCVLTPPLMLAGVESPLRVVAALLLFGLAPGAALLARLAPRSAPLDITLAVGASLAISALLAQLMLVPGIWSPAAGACVLAAVCLAAMAGPLRALRPAGAGS